MRYRDTGNGITSDSIAFYRDHRHRLARIVEAELRFPGFDDPRDPYLMVLRDEATNTIELSGCTTGYAGEGPRGAMQILVEEGWPADQAAQVFAAANLRLRHSDEPLRSGPSDRARPLGLDAPAIVALHPSRRRPGMGRS